MLSAEQCRALANEFKTISHASTISDDRAFIMKNISRTLMGLATQLDLLSTKIREEGAKPVVRLGPLDEKRPINWTRVQR